MPLKSVKSKKYCPDVCPQYEACADSALHKLAALFPHIKQIKRSKIYELWCWLRKEEDAPVCSTWRDDIVAFLYDFTDLMGGKPEDYVRPRISWVYYTMERIDKQGIWEKSNVTVRRFYTERAYHRPTYLYWRLLGDRGLLEDSTKDSYIEFITTFGHKQVGYVLKRRDRRKLHSRDNSFWVRYSKLAGDPVGTPGGESDTTGEGSEST
jgi:hypothetical protein